MRAILAAGVVAVAGMWLDESREIPARSLWHGDTTTVSDHAGEVGSRPQRRGAGFDLYGNPIEEAVGDYRVDPRGDIFERHSPATEIPRLAEPSA